MKKSLLNAIVIMSAFVANGAVYQQFIWAQEPSQAKYGSEEAIREEKAAKREAELIERHGEEFKRHGEEFKRHGEEFKRQAKEFAKVRQKAYTFTTAPHGKNSQIRVAAEVLRDAEGAEAKSQATEKLKEAVDRLFEEDMAHREEAVADLEERLQKLQAQLDRRREKKQEIVDLQMKIVVNEADGLGFSSQSGFEGLNFRVPAPVEMPIIEPHFGDGVIIMPPPPGAVPPVRAAVPPAPSADSAPR